MSEIKRLPCPDCGSSPVFSHRMERWSDSINELIAPFLFKTDQLWLKIERLANRLRLKRLTVPCLRLLAILRLGKIIDQPDEKTGQRGTCFWEAAKKYGVQMFEFRLFHLPVELFFATKDRQAMIFNGLPRPLGRSYPAMEWMDDKEICQKKFGEAGVPVPRSLACRRWSEALNFFQQLNCKAIIKPALGSRSRHTTVDIATEEELKTAFLKAKQISPRVMVQEELRGLLFRPTLIGGRLVAVVRRDPAYVVGDGVSTIRQLAEKENSRPERQGPLFHYLPLDEEAAVVLKRQNLDWPSLPALGQYVFLGRKTSRGSGGSITDVTEAVHPENARLFEKIGELLADPLVGLDFIIEDISRPWSEQKQCGLIECNSLPFIDLHHFPLNGAPRDVASALWEIVLPTI